MSISTDDLLKDLLDHAKLVHCSLAGGVSTLTAATLADRVVALHKALSEGAPLPQAWERHDQAC
jgi:hypothetical protein